MNLTGRRVNGSKPHRAEQFVLRNHALSALLVAMMVQSTFLRPAVAQTAESLMAALARLYVIRRDGDTWRNFLEVSAFFLDEQGTVLTAGLVARPIREHPDTYQIIALKEGSLFGATLVCAPAVPRKPRPLSDDELEKETAVVKLKELDLPFDTWRNTPANGQSVIIGQKHRGRLPAFQSLAIGDDPREGDRVRIAAYGRLLQLKPIPEPWSADGLVTRVFKSATGLPIFAADIGSAWTNWINGSVIVQADGRVAGLSLWDRSGPPAEVLAVSASALREPCR